ncbi:Uu.00g014920.m01.CDS01 [Anthostomella pinea]|uniref:Uu.00g014920.m01.CDS01 n=1 Tax=Anthostomella pinea TaxID=933095 RepID=A0AAI8VYE3_9PEZI|nr:Uu.00g014920.m01.CDS01 [Anthostomella pinea]
MLRNVRQPRPKKPVMLMLHGSGSLSAIFRFQTHGLARELSKSFDLVFLDGPTPSPPGPELFDVARYIQTQLVDQGVKAGDVVAILGFSQGALTAMAMLDLRLAQQSAWQNLRFCVTIGAGTTDDSAQLDGIESMISTLSHMLGQPDGKFPLYSVQASGTRDVWYKDGKRLASMCAKDRTKTMDYRDGHVVPRQRADIMKLVHLITAIDTDSKAVQDVSEAVQPLEARSVPTILAGEDTTRGMAVLADRGIRI